MDDLSFSFSKRVRFQTIANGIGQRTPEVILINQTKCVDMFPETFQPNIWLKTKKNRLDMPLVQEPVFAKIFPFIKPKFAKFEGAVLKFLNTIRDNDQGDK